MGTSRPASFGISQTAQSMSQPASGSGCALGPRKPLSVLDRSAEWLLIAAVSGGFPFQIRMLTFDPVLLIISSSLLGTGEVAARLSFLWEYSWWPLNAGRAADLGVGMRASWGKSGFRARLGHLSSRCSPDRARCLPDSERACPPCQAHIWAEYVER